MVIAVRPELIEKVRWPCLHPKMSMQRLLDASPTTSDLSCDNGVEVGRLEMEFLHEGISKYSRKAVWTSPKLSDTETEETKAAAIGNVVSSRIFLV